MALTGNGVDSEDDDFCSAAALSCWPLVFISDAIPDECRFYPLPASSTLIGSELMFWLFQQKNVLERETEKYKLFSFIINIIIF